MNSKETKAHFVKAARESVDMAFDAARASATPRTDALLAKYGNDWHNPQLASIDFADLARKLETDRAALIAALEAIEGELTASGKYGEPAEIVASRAIYTARAALAKVQA